MVTKRFENFYLVFSIDWDDAVEAYLFQRNSPFKKMENRKKVTFVEQISGAAQFCDAVTISGNCHSILQLLWNPFLYFYV